MSLNTYFITDQGTPVEILLYDEVPLRIDAGQKSNSHRQNGMTKDTRDILIVTSYVSEVACGSVCYTGDT
jgi:hypothetical protein